MGTISWRVYRVKRKKPVEPADTRKAVSRLSSEPLILKLTSSGVAEGRKSVLHEQSKKALVDHSTSYGPLESVQPPTLCIQRH